MGKLFANYEPYDVQATRREARAEGKDEGRAKGIVYAAKQLGGSMESAVQQLIALCDLEETDALEKVKLYW